jgi:hypothetical protein
MEITLNNFETKAARFGIVASVNIRFGDMMTVIGCTVIRPDSDKQFVHVVLPLAARTGEAAVKLSPNLMGEINGRAAALYTAATGIKIRGSSYRPDLKLKATAQPAVEDDAAGLRRVLSAEAETCERAGL